MISSSTFTTGHDVRFKEHYLGCPVCSEVMKTVNIGENQSPEQESAVRRKALCRHGRRLYDKAAERRKV